MPKKSASRIQSDEARATPGSGVASGGRAANAQSIAAGAVSGMHSRGAISSGGGVSRHGKVAEAQSRESHRRQFPESYWAMSHGLISRKEPADRPHYLLKRVSHQMEHMHVPYEMEQKPPDSVNDMDPVLWVIAGLLLLGMAVLLVNGW